MSTLASRPGELVAAYGRTEELRAANAAIDAGLELGGLWGGAFAFFAAAWQAARAGDDGCPTCIVTATEDEADLVASELEAFAAAPVRAFPAWQSLFLEESVPDGDTYCERVSLLEELRRGAPAARGFIVATVHALLQPVPSLERVAAARLTLRVGETRSPQDLALALVTAGLRPVPLVQARGELSSRGDILDVYPFEARHPLRLEYFGDSLESVREFEAESQRSIAGSERDAVEISTLERREVFRDCFRGREVLLLDVLPASARVVLRDAPVVRERAERILRNLVGDGATELWTLFEARLKSRRVIRASSLPLAPPDGALPERERDAHNLRFGSVERFRGRELAQVFGAIIARIATGGEFDLYCDTPAEAKRVEEILHDHGIDQGAAVQVGAVHRGFESLELGRIVLTAKELFNRHSLHKVRKRAAPGKAIQSFLDLEKGDYIVHLVHGVGRYLGMESFARDGVEQEFLALEFRDRVKVYVPVSKIDLVQKYIGAGDRAPILDKVGGTSWSKKKEEVETALLDLASDLIELQARRQERPGFACPPDSEWQRELEAAFPYDETADQVDVTRAIKEDMEAARPMDRLICGDVGYGKTELAMRAAFKAVDAGKQVAVLVPTTVLAQQHFRTFSERMSEFPVTIDVLSRFRSPAEQKETLAAAAAGKVDILIGTHRLLSEDVVLQDLGLVIIDEEQRFGVTHKEKLKRLRSTVDVLTLTATPIPRTLHMSLLGIRDISSLSTAPEGRMPVKTEVCRFEPRHVREIILRELNREGQVYFVHNRIGDIDQVKHELEKAVPEARVEYAHGQMAEGELEDKMVRFFEREYDVLIATTIIESGLDIPNVNTIFIDEADRYGLADLHQLRGRVGRYKHQAYCYLLLPEHRHMNPDAQKRVQALVEFSALGSGFQIAMRDLEIRGAGNILGPEQSGHIALVGYEMYCRLLEKAVKQLRNESTAEPVHVEIDLALEAHVPDGYLPAGRGGAAGAKIDLYRRVAACMSREALRDLAEELTDRFGPVPEPLARLLDVQRLRFLAAAAGIESVGRDGRNLILRGKDSMRKLLADCPVKVIVLDPRTAAIPLVDPARRHPPPVDDAMAFRLALEWLSTGSYPGWAAG